VERKAAVDGVAGSAGSGSGAVSASWSPSAAPAPGYADRVRCL